MSTTDIICPVCNLPRAAGCPDPFGHAERFKATREANQRENDRLEQELRARAILPGFVGTQGRGYSEAPKPTKAAG